MSGDSGSASSPQISFQSQESQIVIQIILFLFCGSSAQQRSTLPWTPVLQVLRLVFYWREVFNTSPNPILEY